MEIGKLNRDGGGDGGVDSSELRKFNSEREGGVGITTEEVEGKEGGGGGGMDRGVKGRK